MGVKRATLPESFPHGRLSIEFKDTSVGDTIRSVAGATGLSTDEPEIPDV